MVYRLWAERNCVTQTNKQTLHKFMHGFIQVHSNAPLQPDDHKLFMLLNFLYVKEKSAVSAFNAPSFEIHIILISCETDLN